MISPFRIPSVLSIFLNAILWINLSTLPLDAQTIKKARKSLLNTDPSVVYIDATKQKPVILVAKTNTPVFSERTGQHRIGWLKMNQTAEVEAIAENSYRIRHKAQTQDISGWVNPNDLSSQTDPDFILHLKQLHERQIQVQALIEAKRIVVGMTLDEVLKSRGKPQKKSVRRNGNGESGSWEYGEYEEVKHYITRQDPNTGAIYRQFSHITQEERNKTIVEFENQIVTAIQEEQNQNPGNVRIIVPPLWLR